MGRQAPLWFPVLSADPIRRGLTASIIEGSMFGVWAAAVTGNYLTGMALYLGAGGLALGILGALPQISTMLQLICAPFVVGLERRRAFLAGFSGLQRFTAAMAGFLALWLYPSPAALVLFVCLQVFAWAAMAPPTVVWQGYMADLVPMQVRGRYFARRNAIIGIVGMVSVLALGRVLDRWPGEPGFRVLYLVAFVAAGFNFAAWYLLPELPVGESRSARPFWASIRAPLTTPGPHRPAAFFFAAWALAQGVAAPFYPVALQQKVGLSFSLVSVLATVQAVTAISASFLMGRWIDRVGQVKAIAWLTAAVSIVPLLYVGAVWGGLPLLVAAHVVNGAAMNGLGLANQTLMMRVAPREDRGSYFAFFAAAGGLTGFAASVLAGPLTTSYLDELFIASALVSAGLSLAWRARIGALVP